MKLLKDFFLNDKNIFLLISLNALIIFLQGFPYETIAKPWQQIFSIIDDIISVLFVFELMVKTRHFGFKNYWADAWNRLDLLLIVLSLPTLLLHLLPLEATANISFLLVFRVFRVFKFFRFIQFFPQVENIFRSIRQAMRASVMVLTGFLVFIFIMSILSCYFYQNVAPEHFGDPIVSYYSMFKVFTIEGWNTIPDEMVKNSNMNSFAAFFTKLYFVLLLVFGGIIGLSIVNSIFVDAMVSDNNDELEEEVRLIKEELTQANLQLQHLVDLVQSQQQANEQKKNHS